MAIKFCKTINYCSGRENSFQIRNSLKWNLTKEHSRGAALNQRHLASPVYEAATHINYH